MKILDVQPFHEGIQRNIVMLQRIGDEMEAIRKATDGLVVMDDSLKGEGGNAIRSFYEECHLPFLQFHSTFQKDFVSILEQMDAALDALEPNPSGFIRESFLEGEIEQGLTEIAQITESLTDEANSIMDQVADIVGLPHLDDSDVQEGVKRAKIKRDDTVTALHEFDTNQTDALTPIETDLATMDSWVSDIESLFTDGTTAIDFPMERWSALTEKNSLKTDLAHRTAEMANVNGAENINHQPGMVVNALLAGQDPFQLTHESVDGPAASTLYDTHIYTTFPGIALRAKLRQGSATEEESGFFYSLKKSWRSIQEIGHDSVEGFKARSEKSFDSPYDFVNHGTFGILDAVWTGSIDRSDKKWNSTSDFFNYLTAGITGTVEGAVNPDDPFSSDHLLNSFGLATSLTGVGKVVTPKPASGVSGASKPKETGQSVGENTDKGTGNFNDPYIGVKEASEYLQSQGVPRQFRKTTLESFEIGTIKLDVAGSNTYGLRFYDDINASAKGRYLFETFSPQVNRGNLALPPEWNKMTSIQQWHVKPGTIIIKGKAGPQVQMGNQYIGGVEQWYITDLDDLIKP